MRVAVNKRAALSVSIIILSIIIYFNRIIFTSDTLFIGDLYTQFFPWKDFLVNSVSSGITPFWNPFSFSGTPFLADVQTGSFYPPSIIFMFVNFALALKIYIVGHFLFMGISLYVLFRALGFSHQATVAGAIIFLFNSFTCAKLNGPAALGAYSLMPLILFSFYRFLFTRVKTYWVMVLILLSLSFLAGHNPTFIHTILFLIFFKIYYLRVSGTFKFRLLYFLKIALFAALSMLIFYMLTMPQSGLFVEFIKNGVGTGQLSYDVVATNSMSYKDLWSFIMPSAGSASYLSDWNSYSTGVMNFFSITAFFMFILSLNFPKNKLYRFSAFTAVFALLLALGKNTPVHSWFYTFFPFFSISKFPGFAITLLVFPVSIISAITIENIYKKNTVQLSIFDKLPIFSRGTEYFRSTLPKRLTGVIITMILLLILIVLMNSHISKVYGFSNEYLINFITAFFIFISIFSVNTILFYMNEKGFLKNTPYIAIILVLIFSEFYMFMIKTSPVTSDVLFNKNKEALETHDLIDTANYKFVHIDNFSSNDMYLNSYITRSKDNFLLSLPSNSGMLYRLSDAAGHNEIRLKNYSDFTSDILKKDGSVNTDKLNILNVKYLITPRLLDLPDFDVIYHKRGFFIYKNQKALPIFFITQDKDKLKLLLSQSSWSRKNEYDFSLYSLTINSPENGYVVFSNNYYPGWEAYENNKAADIERCFGTYMGVRTKKGVHDITFKYTPNNLSRFLTINLLIVLILYVLGIIKIFSRPKDIQRLKNSKIQS